MSRIAGADGRRALRRVAAAFCLVLAFSCLVAAVAMSAQTLPADPNHQKPIAQAGYRLQPVISLSFSFLAFLVVLVAAFHRGHGRARGLALAAVEPRPR